MPKKTNEGHLPNLFPTTNVIFPTGLKNSIVLIILFATTLAMAQLPQAESPSRRVVGIVTSQVGFAPTETKFALFLSDSGSVAPTGNFTLVDAQQNVVFTGAPIRQGFKWDREVWRLDFTSVQDSGSFTVKFANWESRPFIISSDIWSRGYETQTWFESFFARQRMTNEEYPANSNLPKYRLDDQGNKIAISGTHNVDGGWQDAHSDDQYLAHSGIVTQLLTAWEVDSLRFKQESGGQFPAILEEARYGLKFQLSMQNPSGSFHVGVSSSPSPWGDQSPRGVFQDSGYALNARSAAALAQGARVFKGRDDAFANQCLTAAELAWNWSITHRDVHIPPLPGYWNAHYDSHLLAATELWITTGKPVYQDSMEQAILRSSIDNSESWQPYWKSETGDDWSGYFGMKDMIGQGNLLISYGKYFPFASSASRAVILEQVEFIKNRYTSSIDYYGVLDQTWVDWFGVMGTMVSNASAFAYLGSQLNDSELIGLGADQVHATLGRNPTGRSYARGVGTYWWDGEWASNLDNTWGAVFPGIIIGDNSSNPASEIGLPTDNCLISGEMGAAGWRCGEWVTGYTSALIFAVASLNSHFTSIQNNPSSSIEVNAFGDNFKNYSRFTKSGQPFDLLGRKVKLLRW
jgi:endoglucanase